MYKKRIELPPLDLIRGFEAAARTLSFTKAADELSLTQSAISRQIRALEESLGVPLFERRPRSLALTEAGRTLLRTVGEVLASLETTIARLRTLVEVPQLTVSTTGGFASLWLIPRLRTFTASHPDVDVRIAATYQAVDLERQGVDVAVRYCRPRDAPAGALRLFDEELFPVCSPALPLQARQPLRTASDLAHHALLHLDHDANGEMDWDTWLAARGHPGLKPTASIRFDTYEQMIQAAVSRQGVAMGIGRLVRGLMAAGELVAPFGESSTGSRAYFILRSGQTHDRPHVRAFVEWLMQQAKGAVVGGARPGR
ncbi:MAG TPA: transcriptional regulator GcvA [Hyphomicrobiaceae bacterium]|nr:transcriptional regulator GcvA [Hyphomicrobiaceae bacterium]